MVSKCGTICLIFTTSIFLLYRPTKPHCILPLHVVVQPKKNRLILDCTALNEYIVVPKIKFDDYKCALNFFHSKGYLICFDFKDGYYHISIDPAFRKFLGFSLILDGKQVYCQFKVGFLGLCDLPWLFTKIFSACKALHSKDSFD